MNICDFDTILLESWDHSALDSFFKTKRKKYECTKKEFFEGMINSISRFEKLWVYGINEEWDEDGNCWKLFNSQGKVEFLEMTYISFNINTNGTTRSYLFNEDTSTYFANNLKKYFDSNNENILFPTQPQEPLSKESVNINYDLFSKLLNIYFEGIDLVQFTNIIELNRCDKQYKWIGKKKADAVRFMKHFKMSYEKMNNCFIFPDKKKLYSGNEKGISLRHSAGINKILNQSKKK